MKSLIKNFVSYSGLWSVFDQVEWKRGFKSMIGNGFLSMEDWRRKYHENRKGDTFFILGSGYSVNSLSEEDWRRVQNGFSIGFNSFHLHSFVPDLYAFELPTDQDFLDAHIRALKTSSNGLLERPLILHHKRLLNTAADYRTLPWKRELCYHNFPLQLHTNNIRIIRKFIRSGLKHRNVDQLLHYSASVSMWIDLAVKLGYMKIVLVGIDMIDPRFFYESEDYGEKGELFVKAQKAWFDRVNANSQTHSTADKKITARFGNLTVDEFVYALQDELEFSKTGVQLYVGSKSSLLAEKLPVYPW